MKSYKKVIIFVVLVVGFSIYLFRSDLEKKEFSPKNPTSYIFDVEENKLKEIILKLFIYDSYNNPLPLNPSREGRRVLFYTEPDDFISYSENNSYIHLTGAHSWISEIYYYDGNPTKIIGDYSLVLEKIDAKKTKVTVKVIKLKAYAGGHLNMRGGGATMKEVDGTTIEEYIILKHIGNYLKIQMPPVNRPSIEGE